MRRDGYYGKHKEFVRWECVPGSGVPAHYLRQRDRSGLRSKLLGGRLGSCDECERPWQPTDGLPNGNYDKFVLRTKADALVRIGEGGLSLRQAAQLVRVSAVEQRTGRWPLPWQVSRDGRLARDWVSQYTRIIAAHYLPTSWPHAIAVDSFDVRARAFDKHGNPLRKGRHLYSVFLAVGYEQKAHRGSLWHIAAFKGESEREWREFFRQLSGQPNTVLCDGSWAIKNAAAWAFPSAAVYPCAWHIYNRLADRVKAAGLYSNRRRIFKLLQQEKDLFTDPRRFAELERTLARYLRADRSRLPAQTAAGLAAIEKWLARNQAEIRTALSPHWPRDLGLLEEHLAVIQARLGDRRRQFRNRSRLTCVLTLMLLQLRGNASVKAWTRILRDNHTRHDGKPPPRRQDDGDHF